MGERKCGVKMGSEYVEQNSRARIGAKPQTRTYPWGEVGKGDRVRGNGTDEYYATRYSELPSIQISGF